MSQDRRRPPPGKNIIAGFMEQELNFYCLKLLKSFQGLSDIVASITLTNREGYQGFLQSGINFIHGA